MATLTFKRRGIKAVLLGTVITCIILKISNTVIFDSQPRRPQYWDPLANKDSRQKRVATLVESHNHRYRSDGLLEVNVAGSHPIYELMTHAEKNWNHKLSKASKSLEEAVAEYKRRYLRPPPKGFDRWWKYVEKHNIQLPDEYDSIFEDFQPFYSLSPSDLIKIRNENEGGPYSCVVGKNETSTNVDILSHAFEQGKNDDLMTRAQGLIEIFRLIEWPDLPKFCMTVSTLGVPSRVSDYRVNQAAMDAVTERTLIDRSALPKITIPGWVMACAPTSSARRRRTMNLDNPPPRPKKKTFIRNHVQSMNPCDNPHLFYHHGFYLAKEKGPMPERDLVLEFSYSSTALHHDIRLPSWPGLERSFDELKFDQKQNEQLLWRGEDSGMISSNDIRQHRSHRHHLVSYANDLDGTIEVLPSNTSRTEKMGDLRTHEKAHLNSAIMDIAFVNSSCSGASCDRVHASLYSWKKKQTRKEESNYKYVLDIDGNGPSRRFRPLLASNSLVFKSTIFPEWYADRIQPWLHYVPIQVDFDDLHDALLFFRGDRNGEGSHKYLARRIALAGREWSRTYWRREDAAAYLFRMTLEYARLMSTDREEMSYKEETNW